VGEQGAAARGHGAALAEGEERLVDRGADVARGGGERVRDQRATAARADPTARPR